MTDTNRMITKNIRERFPAEFAPALAATSEALGLPLNFDDDLVGSRKRFNTVALAGAIESGRRIDGVTTKTIEVRGADGAPVPLIVYQPEEAPAEAVGGYFWMHGGGLVVGQAAHDEPMLKAIVRRLGCTVTSVDYRLAPEHPFPTPLHDCYAALKYVHQNAAALTIDPSRIVVGGGSAGGGLAAALAQYATDLGEVPIAHQMLLYPMLDPLNVTQADDGVEDTYIWTRANNRFGWKSYLGRSPSKDAIPKYSSALYNHDLVGLPPATVMVGDIDLFASENMLYAARLSAAGSPVELHVFPGGIHGFQDLNPAAQISERFHALHDRALDEAIRGGSSAG